MILFHLRSLAIGISNYAQGEIFSSFRFQLLEFWRVEVKKRIDLHCQTNCLSNFYFVRSEPYRKIVNVTSISFTEMYHDIFFHFQNFEFQFLL